MRAMFATTYGAPDVLTLSETEPPDCGDQDLLIEVFASSLNPVDTKLRKHGLGGMRTPPYVCGFDVSGVVAKVGAGVNGFKPGDEVYGFLSLLRDGAHAEYVAADYRTIAIKPKSVDHISAAAVPLVLLTAWEALYDRLNIRSGETVLIQAGGGGVGHIGIQLAKLRGARVLTTASSDESKNLCLRLGADEVIDYRQSDFVAEVMRLTAGKGATAIADFVGGGTFARCLDCLAPEGRIATIVEGDSGPLSEKLFFKNATMHYVFIGAPLVHGLNPERQGKVLSEARLLIDEGKLAAHVSKVLTLDELPRGHELQESGKMAGKIAIKIK